MNAEDRPESAKKLPDRKILADIVEMLGYSITDHLPKVRLHYMIAGSTVDILDWNDPSLWDRIKPVLQERHAYYTKRAADSAAYIQIVEQMQESNSD